MAATTMLSIEDGATHHRPTGFVARAFTVLQSGGNTVAFQHNFHLHVSAPVESWAGAPVTTADYIVHLIPRGHRGGVAGVVTLGIPAASLQPTVALKQNGRVVINDNAGAYLRYEVWCELIHSQRY